MRQEMLCISGDLAESLGAIGQHHRLSDALHTLAGCVLLKETDGAPLR